jgi:ADP-heptose:LPS heptosyltransferase
MTWDGGLGFIVARQWRPGQASRMPRVNCNTAPSSLLIIKPSSLGDIVHALQLVQTVARALPECRITWVARDRFAPLVEAAPFVHEVIHFRRKNGWRGILDVLKILRSRRFDAVWDMQGLLRSGLMAAAARAEVKWGRHDSREGAALFTRKVKPPPGKGPHHAIPVLQEFARTLGITSEILFPLELRPGQDFAWKRFFEGDSARRFVIFTDSRGAEKEWPHFGGLTRLILENIADSRVAWCAGKPAAPDFPVPDGRFLNLTGCPFDEMIELCRQPSVFIGNDSGPMHLSASVGNRVLAIFGPTSPDRFGPWPPGSPRARSVRAPDGLLAKLSPDAVLEEIILMSDPAP